MTNKCTLKTIGAGKVQVAAAQGHPDAQHDLGGKYEDGLGVPQDYAEAAKWFRLAAEQGLADAQNNLGLMYGNGLGVPRDYAEAVKWHGLAARQGTTAKASGMRSSRSSPSSSRVLNCSVL